MTDVTMDVGAIRPVVAGWPPDPAAAHDTAGTVQPGGGCAVTA